MVLAIRCYEQFNSLIHVFRRCNAGKFLLHNRCVDDCSDAGLAAYIPGGSFGRECREVFICADGVDREGAPCRCPKSAGAGCLACAWTMAGSEW